MGLGYVEGVTRDCIRQGPMTLFAALDIVNGGVIAQTTRRHRHQEFLGFLKHTEEQVPPGLDVQGIVDNYATHSHRTVRRWLLRHPRWHIHHTSTYASWLNQVEICFNLITQEAILRGTFSSVKELTASIQQYVDHYNRHPRPFIWTASADSILAKIDRLCHRISRTRH